MARLPKGLDPAVRAELMRAPDGEAELKRFNAKRKTQLDKQFPKPDAADVNGMVAFLETRFDSFHHGVGTAMIGATTGSAPASRQGNDEIAGINGTRDMRYHRDKLPPKWERQLEGATRIRSNLTNSEIGNVAAILGRNPIRARIPPVGRLADATQRANRETRWSNALPDAMERATGIPIRQEVNDSLAESSVCAVEFYITDAYDGVDFRKVSAPPSDAMETSELDEAGEVEESDHEYEQRIERTLLECGLPFAFRPIDPLSLVWDSDQYGPYVAIISQRKPYHRVYNALRAKLTPAELRKANLPHPFSTGIAERYTDYAADGVVLTRTYYDRRWYLFMVGNEIIECREHGFPGLPVRIGYGKVTSAPTLGEKYQGVTWGMGNLERALNDRLTLDFDVAVTYSRPLPYVETDVGSQIIRERGTNTPAVLDLTRGVLQLQPGQHLKDATANFRVQHTEGLDLLMGLFTRSGMNPIAKGESPGSDVSGYAINSLSSSALSQYDPWIKGIGRFWGDVIDFSRLTVRDTIGEDVYLTAPMQGRSFAQGAEWLQLGPTDVSEVPCQVYIDPLSETNRSAIAAYYSQGVTMGLVPEEILMERGYGADSPDEWYAMIDRNAMRRQLRVRGIQEVLAGIDARAAAQAHTVPTEATPGGTPLLPPGPEPATVGAEQAAASQSAYNGDGAPTSAENAGQRPPAQGTVPGEVGPT